ncbi:MAG TPA: PEP-CTERM sorting domain-containing protein [Phycisphaerae bacterium]|nr:PEP-CTERM sorting domain-containing protein [Phycisphaerales bacterium]HRX85919.1 PEP-CTERM sorting domain-containing protein [Phycisphaerae bacterium]
MSGRTRIWTTLAVAAIAVWALGFASPAQATVLTDFSSFSVDAYGTWSTGTLTPGANDFRVEATGGFGGGWHGLGAPASAAPSETTIEFALTANSGNQAGMVLVLVDGDGTEWGYGWFGLPEGAQTLTEDVSNPLFSSNDGTTPGLDTANIIGFHLQGDVGTQTPGITDLTFDNLALTPEPASLALLGLGALFVSRRRSR